MVRCKIIISGAGIYHHEEQLPVYVRQEQKTQWENEKLNVRHAKEGR